ncbi:MAG: single-stranded DNA-binding protein [Succinivibrio sp.]|nr:single-stranded DNA-binding protein [Succinivibrio sp.]
MARGLNKVILIGNLGDEPTMRSSQSGIPVANFSMVTNDVRRNPQTGETTEYAEWHRIVMWNKLAEIAGQYLHKGSRVYIEGKLRTRSYTDKTGVKRMVTEISADEMLMLDSRRDSGAASPADGQQQWGQNSRQSEDFGRANSNSSFGGNSFNGGNGSFGGYEAPQQPQSYGQMQKSYDQNTNVAPANVIGSEPVTEPEPNVRPQDDDIPF